MLDLSRGSNRSSSRVWFLWSVENPKWKQIHQYLIVAAPSIPIPPHIWLWISLFNSFTENLGEGEC